MAETVLTYSPAYIVLGFSFSWSNVTFTSTDDGLTYTGSPIIINGAVPNNAKLTSITIGNNVTSISSNVFNQCSLLTTVTFTPVCQIQTLNSQVFGRCTSLLSITIPSSVTSINVDAFNGCSNLSSFEVDPASTIYSSIDGVLFSKDGATLILFPYSPTSYDVPNTVITIDIRSFFARQNLTLITFESPSQLQTIGRTAFQSCSNLTSIEIPSSVTNIDGSFLNCNKLASVTFQSPSQLSIIGSGSFNNCAFTTITIPNSVTLIDAGAFQSCSNLTSFAVEPVCQIQRFEENVFLYCYDLTSIEIPNSVTFIGASVFNSCSFLTSVILPTNVDFTSISQSLFANCIRLPLITINNNITNVGSNSFENCSALTTVVISDATAQRLNATWNSPSPPPIYPFYSAPNPVNFETTEPTIITISPSYGNRSGGEPVTIAGVNLSGSVITVTFGTTTVPASVNGGGTLITCTTPPHAIESGIPVYATVDGFNTNSLLFDYIICFKEGTKILTDKGYNLIQNLRKGDLVKTVSSGFKKIEHIGHSKMYHNANNIRSKDKLYRCPTSEYPELFEDLIITGGHSILIRDFKDSEQRLKTKDINGDTYVTDGYYRLPACVDDRTKIFDQEGIHTIWHFSLENSNYYSNYGVYANGLLVESTSNRMMVELSGMTLLE